MNIYFSEVTKDDIESWGDEGTFVTKDHYGEVRYFYNGVEHGTNPGGIEEVRIFDGCNRSIPIAVDNIPDLIEALQFCLNNVETIQHAQRLEHELSCPNHNHFVEDSGYGHEVV